ncbi:LysR family transcriptional regulator [Vibrio hippocampi]|uniref:HTH-type transcriptional regulator LeuO n=1 Tax=Vibrio hippocampi TaxID=654686 RepID=A0ABM8ZPV3_9VIBR|nr:LysR family transcriptional regulator [Vibrio hippocampi]CAH0530183.1 HTH-type transcriptional regulator LeuO [Vibrio hippocampi]
MFKYFIAVIEEQGVSNAAKALGVTPSAVSQNIAKLNEFYNDVLFVRVGTSLVATTNGMNLYRSVKPAVEELSSQAKAHKNPTKSKRTISFLSHKDVDLLFYPQLLERVSQSGFDISLLNTTTSVNEELWFDELVQRKADFILSTQPMQFTGYESTVLLKQEPVSVCRTDHPYKEKLTDEQGFFELDFIAYTTRQNHKRLFQNMLKNQPDTRNIVYQSDSMLTSLYMVSKSDLVCLAFTHHAEKFKQALGLSILPLPFKERVEVPIYLSYRKNIPTDTALKWVIEQLEQIFSEYH